MLEHSLVHLGGYTWCLFPWLGTRSFRTLRKLIKAQKKEFDITGVEYEGCYYIKFKMTKENDFELISRLAREAERGIDAEALVEGGETPVFEKYDDYIPTDLLRHAYAVDKLDPDEAGRRVLEILAEY